MSSLSFFLIFVMSLKTIDFSAHVDFCIIVVLCILYFISYLTFLGFAKFYRRYTLENLMALLTCVDEDNNGFIKDNK